MKILKKALKYAKMTFRHDVIGFYKNILIVGKKNELSENLINSLNNSFNIYSILNTESYKEKLFYERNLEIENFSEKNYLEKIKTDFLKMDVKFDSIIILDEIFENCEKKKNKENYFEKNFENENFFEENNLKKMNLEISKNLIYFKLAQKFLRSSGALFTICNKKNFDSKSENLMKNIFLNNHLHFDFINSEELQESFNNRFYTLILDDGELFDKEKYIKDINKTIIKWIFNRKEPDHNSYVFMKQEENKTISTYYE